MIVELNSRFVVNLMWFLWTIIMMIPVTIIIIKFTEYVYMRPFQEWWLSVIWLFSLPVTTLIIIAKIKKD